MNRLRSSYLAALAAVLIAAATSASASSCYPRDVVMLFDQSGSTKSEFNAIKELSEAVVDDFDVGTTGEYFDYFSLVGYTDAIKKEIGFGKVENLKKLKAQIDNLQRFKTESSSIPYALNHAIQRLKQFKRNETQQVVLIVSDGVLDIPTNPATSVYGVCNNIDDAKDLAYTSLQTCVENLVVEATESDDIIFIQIPTDDSVGTDNIFTSSNILSSYVKQATSSYGAVSESCTEMPTHSPTAPTGSPTLLLDTSCYVSKKRYNGKADSTETASSAEECGTLCYTTDSCECFSFRTDRKKDNCFLFKSVPVASQKKKYISGPKYCSTVQDITDAPTPMPTDAPTDAPTPSPTPPPSMVKSTVYKRTTLSSAYSMSFDFTLDAINSESPQSVIQRGSATNKKGYVRQPAVFVDEGSSQLRFRISTSVDSNQGCETEAELELGVTYGIEVRVVEGESAGLYIDGELACSIDFVEGETLSYLGKRLPIYIGSPEDFVTASGTVANLIYKDITSAPTPEPTGYPTPEPTGYPTPEPTGYPTPEPTGYPTPQPTGYPTPEPTGYPTPSPTLPPSMELTVFEEDVYFGSSYTITFDLTLDAYNSEIRSVIQRGEGVLAGPTYIRQPAVFVKSENKLALRLSTSITSNKACDVDAGLELDTTYQITITVTEGESAILSINEAAGCTISFDEGETLLYVGERLPLYIGSPEDFSTVSGSVENLIYKDITSAPTPEPTGYPTPQPTGYPTPEPTGYPTPSPTLPPSMELTVFEEDVYFGSSYTITFDLTLDAYNSEIRSVIQRGEGVLAGPTYIRQPAVFVKSENKLALRLSTSITSNKACDVDAGLELDTTYQITITVTEGESAILSINEDAGCTISFDEGETLLYVGERLPLYIGSPEDFSTVSGSVENLIYKDITSAPTPEPTGYPTPQPTLGFGGNGGGNGGGNRG